MKKRPTLALLAILAVCFLSESALAEPPWASTARVSWAGRMFFDADELRAWLNERGVSYRTWAENHPQAAVWLTAKDAEQARPPLAGTPALPSLVAAPSAEPFTEPLPAASSARASALSVGLTALAVALLMLSMLPRVPLQRVRVPAIVAVHQLELAGAGLAIGIALAAAYLL